MKNCSPFVSLADDIELVQAWASEASDLRTDAEVRRMARLIKELTPQLSAARDYYGLKDEAQVRAPSLALLMEAMAPGCEFDHVRSAILGGALANGKNVFLFAFHKTFNESTGVPADAEEGFAMRAVAKVLDPSEHSVVDGSEFVSLTLEEFFASPAVISCGQVFSRGQVIDYFADRKDAASRSVVSGEPPSGLELLEGMVDCDGRDGLLFSVLSTALWLGLSHGLGEVALAIRDDQRQRAVGAPGVQRADGHKGEMTFFIRSAKIDSVDPDAPVFGRLLNGLRPRDPLYRTVNLNRLRHFLETGTLSMSRPTVWDDPFETLLEHAVVVDQTGAIRPLNEVMMHLRAVAFGQCWSRLSESDAIWRIYSDPEDEKSEGVRLHIRAESLLRAASAQFGTGSFCLGLVKYGHESWVLRQAYGYAMAAGTSPDIEPRAFSLLLKRAAFSHEHEARLLVFSDKVGSNYQDLRLDVKEVTTLTLDPRLSPEKVALREAEFRRLGYAGRILHSSLYRGVGLQLPQLLGS